MLDPAWRSRCEADRRFADILAQAFYDANFEVVWIVDTDDPRADCSYVRLRRILPPGRTGTTALVPDAGSGHHWIELIDGWARATWRSASSSFLAKAAAVAAWASVRVLYRVENVMALASWNCARALGVLARQLYRRAAFPFLRLGSRTYFDLPTIAGVPGAADSRGTPVATELDSVPAQLAGLVATLETEDILVLPSAELSQFEMLFQLLPYLGVSRPVSTTLHVRFACSYHGAGHRHEDGTMLTARLRSGSPIRTIVLHADTAEQCHALEQSLGLRVHVCGGDRGPTVVVRRFAGPLPVRPAVRETRGLPPSLVVDQFGSVVLLISALWGRTGSSAVFDAQTRYLIERGFIVTRIFVDHYPRRGPSSAMRREQLLAENFETLRPHLYLVAERNRDYHHLRQLQATQAFRESSPVGRMGMLLADAKIDRPAVAAWYADRAVLTVVNHLPHVAFAERLARAPIVLETHDIYAKLLVQHGIPEFVPKGPDGASLRETDEIDVWRRVAACVNLSPDDHAVVTPVAKCSALARPYIHRTQRPPRSWPDVLTANRLPSKLRTATPFDIMLWGDWHQGNVAGIRWFLDQVAPRHICLQQASILLVGRAVQALPPRLLQRQRLYAVGFVDFTDDFFTRSTVLVIPDQPGSTGTSIKAMDAFARGCCFASTAAGLRGISLGDTRLAPSNDPAALALDIAGLLQSRDARRTRAAAARRLYELNFSKAAYSEAWDAILRALLPGHPMSAISRSPDLAPGPARCRQASSACRKTEHASCSPNT